MALRFSEFVLDPDRYVLERDGLRVAIRPKVFDLLVHLVRNRHRIVRREELVEALWGGTVVGAGSLSGLVNELRQALGESGRGPSSIRTVHARGYQFVAEVEAGVDELLDRESRRRGLPPLPRTLVEALAERPGDGAQLVDAIFDWVARCPAPGVRGQAANDAGPEERREQRGGAPLLRVESSHWPSTPAHREASAGEEEPSGRGPTVS